MLLKVDQKRLGASGAAGTASLRVETGVRCEIHFPEHQRASVLELPASCVAGNGFPSAALGVFVDRVADRLQAIPQTRIGVFAHVEPAGGPDAEKRASDAMARVVHVVLTNDEAGFESLSAERGWDVAEHQAMLRALGCNPAAIDGDAGNLTALAVQLFQEEWNLGWHHPDGPGAPLGVGDELDDATRRALRRAYLLMLAGQFSVEQFSGPGWSGCGSFVPRRRAEPDGVPTTSARITLALYADQGPPRFPCVADSADACRIDDVDAIRCRFYRHVIEESTNTTTAPVFFDFEWMPLPSGRVNLSVLTSLPDGARPMFEIYRRVTDYDGRVRSGHTGDGGDDDGPRGELVAVVPGIVRLGVAVALFDPPQDWSPFDLLEWWDDVELDGDGGASGSGGEGPAATGFQPPVFRVLHDGSWADSCAPGRRLDRIPVDDARDGGVAVTNRGDVVQFWFEKTRAWPGERRRADEHLRVITWQSADVRYEVEEDAT